MITLYGLRSDCPELTVPPESARAFAKEQGYEHPVLLDHGCQYSKRLKPGPAVYPVLYVIGRDGRVAWEGGVDQADFASACEAALLAALAVGESPPPAAD